MTHDAHDWRIYVRDGAGQRVAELDEFSDATIIPRFNAVGSWSLTAPKTPAAQRATDAQHGLEFVRNDEVVMSGPVTSRSRRFATGFDGYAFGGVDDTIWLARRLASPEPGTAGPPYATDAYDIRTGDASTVLHGYVDDNAGPGAVVARRVASFTLDTDAGIGATVTGRARWQNLLDLCVELAAAGGIGFDVRRLVFATYEPVDRSAQVKFSTDLGNLAAFSYTEEAPNFDHVVVAGGGEGVARVIVEATDATAVTGWGRIESFRDRRDTTDVGELGQTAAAELAENATRVGLALTPRETESIRYLDSYRLGDIVTVVVDGIPIVDVVREVTITLNDAGETVTPLVGDPAANPDRPRIFDLVARLGRRVRDIERT